MSPKQQRFVQEYLVDLNATQAAIRAGYAKGSASVTSCRLLANAKIKAVLDRHRAKASKRLEISAERVIEETGRLAFSNITNFYTRDADGNLALDETAIFDPAKAASISQMEVQTKPDGTQTVKIKLADKRAALADLSRHLGISSEPVEPAQQTPKDLCHLAMAIINTILDGQREMETSKQIQGEVLNDESHLMITGPRLRRRRKGSALTYTQPKLQ